MRPLVYIACPISSGNRNHNYFQSCEAERELMLRGFAPHNPAHTMVLPFAWQEEYTHQLWLDCCYPIVARSDAVLRLPGYSVGADAECKFAADNEIPVYYDLDSLEELK
jgi:hypothetical protein